MSILIISDLHLDPDNQIKTQLFLNFLHYAKKHAERLYILGDLFEQWIGDDDRSDFHCLIQDHLKKLAQSGIPVFFMHGNRDFLVGQRFADNAGCTLLDEYALIELYNKKALLCHGDTLCTDDESYQRFRRIVRCRLFQRLFLRLPLRFRQNLAKRLRLRSQESQQYKSNEIMDTNPEAIRTLMQARKIERLIHGHTHRPNLHYFRLDGTYVQRIVLSDWENDLGNVLIIKPDDSLELRYFGSDL